LDGAPARLILIPPIIRYHENDSQKRTTAHCVLQAKKEGLIFFTFPKIFFLILGKVFSLHRPDLGLKSQHSE
jgi:hypothetical protein